MTLPYIMSYAEGRSLLFVLAPVLELRLLSVYQPVDAINA